MIPSFLPQLNPHPSRVTHVTAVPISVHSMSHRQYGKVAGHRLGNKFSPQYGNKLAARPKGWVCCGSLPATVGSNHAGVMSVSILCVLCVVRQRSLRRVDHSSRGVLPSVGCLRVIAKHRNKYGNYVHYRVNNSEPNIPILSRMKPVHVLKSYSYNTQL